jgi:hypothetical protein
MQQANQAQQNTAAAGSSQFISILQAQTLATPLPSLESYSSTKVGLSLSLSNQWRRKTISSLPEAHLRDDAFKIEATLKQQSVDLNELDKTMAQMKEESRALQTDLFSFIGQMQKKNEQVTETRF